MCTLLLCIMLLFLIFFFNFLLVLPVSRDIVSNRMHIQSYACLVLITKRELKIYNVNMSKLYTSESNRVAQYVDLSSGIGQKNKNHRKS